MGIESFAYLEHPPGDGVVQGNAGDTYKLWSVILHCPSQLPGVIAGDQEVQDSDLNALLEKDRGQITQGKGREWALLQRV
jgi:hypothetical protein